MSRKDPPVVPPALTAAAIELGISDQETAETEDFRTELFAPDEPGGGGEGAQQRYSGLRRGVEYLFAALSEVWQLARDGRAETASLRDRASDLDGRIGAVAVAGRHAGRVAVAALLLAGCGLVAGVTALLAVAVLHGPALLQLLRHWQAP